MSTSREAIEMLMPAFFFDAVESGGKIRFVKRGGTVAATLEHTDALVNDGRPDAASTRGKETELPYQVSVKFPDTARDHEVNSLYARRLAGSSLTVTALDLPINMSADKGQQVAEVNLFTAWWSRQMWSLSVSHRQLAIEPTDLVSFTKDGLPSQTYRVTRKDLGTNGEIKMEMVRDEPAIYTSTATGTSGNYIGQSVAMPLPSALYTLDIPLLRDQDDGHGYYLTACGYQSNWQGCVVFRSLDDGGSYADIETFTNAATVGNSTTALANFSGGNVFDEHSVVRVLMMSGTLSSLTEAQVLAGGNTAILGDEIIQFKTATLVSAGVYDLSGLLRGRRGTEWAMSGHTAVERFIVANTQTWSREALQSSDVGRDIWFKPVTFGMGLAETVPQSLLFSAACLKPYAPVLPCVGRDASGNITIGWTRRTRTGGAWLDYVDASLGETSELYDVEIYTSGTYATLKRTFSDQTSATVSYTSAQQVTDFGGNQSTIYFKVYQKSTQYGRGNALIAQG
jgi:hypothetical protein